MNCLAAERVNERSGEHQAVSCSGLVCDVRQAAVLNVVALIASVSVDVFPRGPELIPAVTGLRRAPLHGEGFGSCEGAARLAFWFIFNLGRRLVRLRWRRRWLGLRLWLGLFELFFAGPGFALIRGSGIARVRGVVLNFGLRRRNVRGGRAICLEILTARGGDPEENREYENQKRAHARPKRGKGAVSHVNSC